MPCAAMTMGHSRYCELTDPTAPENTPGDPRHRPGRAEGFTAIVCEQVEQHRAADQRVMITVASEPPRPLEAYSVEPEPLPPPRVALVPLDVTLELNRRMNACPYRGALGGCGCSALRPCALGRGRDGKVADADCLACLQSDDPPDAPGSVAEAGTSPDPPAMPSLLQRAANFAGAVASHVLAGLPQSPEAMAAARLAACWTCDRLKGSSCAECGCVVAVKAQWADQDCPLGRWPKAAVEAQTV